MVPLLSCQDISKAYGANQLFSDISLQVYSGDKIGMIGPNGSGKSTLMQILADAEPSDAGEITRRRDLRVGYVPQQSEQPDLPIEELLLQALASDTHLEPFERQTRVEVTLGKVGFTDFKQRAGTLSGGWRKRLDIALQLVTEPDLLLLDEPTNHLDLDGILWLERFLRRQVETYIVISHDRAFLEAVSSRLMELNRRYPSGLFAVNGTYSKFMEKRAELFAGQETRKSALASKMRRELEWLRTSPKARTTKSRSRIQSAHALSDELQDLKQRTTKKKASISFSATERQTRKLIAAHNLTLSRGGKTLFEGLDVTLSPGTRLGIVGANGTGKSSLLKLFSGELKPEQGTIKEADDSRIVLFDQHREQIPLDTSLRYALAADGETVYYHGKAIHVSGWAQRFLFPSDRLDQPIGRLSGGERARILIARLVLEPADVLLLDEPTNDLDIETLEILEESLAEFPGAVVLITHDRLMMDEVCKELVGLGTESDEMRFADYAQWEAQRAAYEKKQEEPKTAPRERKAAPKKRFSYHQQRELAGMEDKILAAEEALEKCQAEVNDPGVQADGEKMQEVCRKLDEAQKELDTLYQRWEELEQLRQGE